MEWNKWENTTLTREPDNKTDRNKPKNICCRRVMQEQVLRIQGKMDKLKWQKENSINNSMDKRWSEWTKKT